MTTTTRKVTLAVAGAALALGALAGCGGDSGGDSGSSAPDNASKDDFCESFNGLFENVMAKVGSGGDKSDAIAAIKDWAADMQDVGTPSDMPEDARKGFEVFVEAAADMPDDATFDDLQNLGGDLSKEDQAAGDAFGEWATENCPNGLPDIGDLPSDLPSDLESLPSDLPTDPSELASMMSELTASADG